MSDSLASLFTTDDDTVDFNLLDPSDFTFLSLPGAIFTREGDDVLRLHETNPHAFYAVGTKIYLEEGNDRLTGSALADHIDAGIGNDTVTAGDGDDVVFGRDGDDYLLGAAGNDTLIGGEGANTLHGGYGNDLLIGGSGAETIYGGYGNDRVKAGGGNDVITDVADNDGGDDTFDGGDGDDEIHGEHGHDTLLGGTGNDKLFGGQGDDRLLGGDGADMLDGGIGSDIIHGHAGDDDIRDGDRSGPSYQGDDDAMYGGAGDDRLETLDGVDRLFGDEGNDTFVFRNHVSNLIDQNGLIHGGDGRDTLLMLDSGIDLRTVPNDHLRSIEHIDFDPLNGHISLDVSDLFSINADRELFLDNIGSNPNSGTDVFFDLAGATATTSNVLSGYVSYHIDDGTLHVSTSLDVELL